MLALDGTHQADYEVELTRTPLGEGSFDHQIRVSLPEGQTRQMSQRVEATERGFRIISEDGNGGGHDLGDGFLTTYTEDGEGTAFASSIFMDGDEMRILRYELNDGEAVRFFRERYSRQ